MYMRLMSALISMYCNISLNKQYSVVLNAPDQVQQFVGTVASSNEVFQGRPMDNPSTEELLKYILEKEIKETCVIGSYSGKIVCMSYIVIVP